MSHSGAALEGWPVRGDYGGKAAFPRVDGEAAAPAPAQSVSGNGDRSASQSVASGPCGFPTRCSPSRFRPRARDRGRLTRTQAEKRWRARSCDPRSTRGDPEGTARSSRRSRSSPGTQAPRGGARPLRVVPTQHATGWRRAEPCEDSLEMVRVRIVGMDWRFEARIEGLRRKVAPQWKDREAL
jgi:hypothetical protein